MISSRFDELNAGLEDSDGRGMRPVGGLNILQWLMACPFSAEEVNYLTQLPIDQIETRIGIPAGSYDYAEHYPRLLAYSRRKLAEAMLTEMLKVNDEFIEYIQQLTIQKKAIAKADQDRKIAEAEERARKKAEEEVLAAEKAAAEAAAAAGRGLGPTG